MPPINPQSLKPAELMRILNTAGRGTVLTETRLRRHRNRAGYAIGDDKTINLFRYAAWMTLEYFRPKSEPQDYAEKKRLQALRNAEEVRAAQDIGDLPDVGNPQRKEAATGSFRYFCEAYFRDVFYLPWSHDHLHVIQKIENAVTSGGLFAMAMPRGSGKALALDTPIITPNGWTTMGDLKVGDRVFDENGKSCTVTFTTEIQYNRDCYKVVFSDGERIVCDAGHLWTIYDVSSHRNPITIDTMELQYRILGEKRKIFLPRSYPDFKTRRIEKVYCTNSVPVRCIQVDSPNSLYLAGRKMVPTHNTVLCQTAVVWASLIGAVPFVCLIAASAERAKDLLENIKTWLETNPLLIADFPEVCYPIQCLERITNRQKGQKYKNEPTRIEWNADKIVLPTIDGSAASGVVISCSGMRGSDIRGQHFARPDGQVVRPQLVLIDDPQTTESAWSESQSTRREAILAGDVLGMAGPDKKIAGLMACTIIRPGDMAHNILDRDKHPEWQGERTKMVYMFPANEKLWSKYAELRGDSLRNDGDGSIATRFYEQNREAMDAGSRVAWPDRYNSDEISALQHAMNLKIRDENAFMSEYQNSPVLEKLGEEMLTAEQIAEKTNGYDRGVIPLDCNHVTMFVDVQQKALYWLLCAWDNVFNGYILDYGTWPDQQRVYFTLRDIQKTLAVAIPNSGLEGAIYGGLEKLCDERLNRVYYREDGVEMRVNQCIIDSNWGQSTDVVYQFCRQSQHAAILFPSHGKYVGASSIPFAEYAKKRGDRVGHHWRIPNTAGKRQVRHVLIDTNYWKSFVHARFAVNMGDPGCLSLFGHDPKVHALLSEHLVAEYRVQAMANGHTVDEWKIRPSHPDNHWLDCLVGCAVAASIQGVELGTLKTIAKPQRPRVKLSEFRKS